MKSENPSADFEAFLNEYDELFDGKSREYKDFQAGVESNNEAKPIFSFTFLTLKRITVILTLLFRFTRFSLIFIVMLFVPVYPFVLAVCISSSCVASVVYFLGSIHSRARALYSNRSV